MNKKSTTLILLCITYILSFSQTYPTFGPEKAVTITGNTLDAMEPFISADGNTLFFNSLNNGTTTSLYYATRVNDTTFTFVGQVNGVNDPTPHLDAVASMDSANNFFWVSTRNYPTVFENYQHGSYNAGSVTKAGRVKGNFYVYTPGWLIMDAAINYNGKLLIYCNAWFNNCGGLPCKARLGIAQKLNDSTFNKTTTSEQVLANINDSTYIVYAPEITRDGLELYFTRIKNGTTLSEICVSVRTSLTDVFSMPKVIYSNQPQIPEAATIVPDKSRIYYHKKPGSLYKIFMRYRTISTGINERSASNSILLFPNPAESDFRIIIPDTQQNVELTIYDMFGQTVLVTSRQTEINISGLQRGIYTVVVKYERNLWQQKFIKQ
ncbi:MAG: T9SS type A sorting domain-containing protein [Bacteroidia bacterium]|nr:T9SS type A sorting domain-containing protein [Bacteroidia bacterium]